MGNDDLGLNNKKFHKKNHSILSGFFYEISRKCQILNIMIKVVFLLFLKNITPFKFSLIFNKCQDKIN